MRRWRQAARAAYGAAILMVCCPALSSAAPLCDEYDPASPRRSARIVLNASDFTDESRDEMRSFIMTGSLGNAEAAVVAATPRDIVRTVSAVPQISRFAPNHGERLKGIAIAVSLRPGARPARVVVDLRQVCAQFFRNTFLYY
jgi:hypothetical protein